MPRICAYSSSLGYNFAESWEEVASIFGAFSGFFLVFLVAIQMKVGAKRLFSALHYHISSLCASSLWTIFSAALHLILRLSTNDSPGLSQRKWGTAELWRIRVASTEIPSHSIKKGLV